jgi:dipeptidyl aminopeptidase/acylaminoacyl peptidase
MKLQFYKRMGDPTTEEGRALLTERSPLTHADKIRRPLLIGQGANDPRVNVAESDQIVAAMKAHDIPVTYVVFPDEGHGFARPQNNIAFNAVAENFLAGCLGGRAEPIGDTLGQSTAEVRHGAEHVKGLTPTAAKAGAKGE